MGTSQLSQFNSTLNANGHPSSLCRPTWETVSIASQWWQSIIYADSCYLFITNAITSTVIAASTMRSSPANATSLGNDAPSLRSLWVIRYDAQSYRCLWTSPNDSWARFNE